MATSFSKLKISAHYLKVRLLEPEERFNGGASILVKPESIKKGERNTAHEAIVLEIGPQAFQIFGDGETKGLPRCKVGDHILMTKFNAFEQEDCTDEEDSKLRVVLDENIIGVFK